MKSFENWDVNAVLNSTLNNLVLSNFKSESNGFPPGNIGGKLFNDLNYLKKTLKKIKSNTLYFYFFLSENDSKLIAESISQANHLINKFQNFSKLKTTKVKKQPTQETLSTQDTEYYLEFEQQFWYVKESKSQSYFEKLQFNTDNSIISHGRVPKLNKETPDFFQQKVLAVKQTIDRAYKPALKKIKMVFWLLVFTFGLSAPVISLCNRVNYGTWNLFAHKPSESLANPCAASP